MEKDKIMPDLEQVVYEFIRFFMDWGLWDAVLIKCGGKVYTDVETAELFTSDESDIYYGCEKETGFRGLEDTAVITVSVNPEGADGELDENASSRRDKDEYKTVMTVILGFESSRLFGDGEFSFCYGKLSTEVKRFLLANSQIGEFILDDMQEEMEERQDQDWILQDYDSFGEWAQSHDILGELAAGLFPDGLSLNLGNPEIYDDWLVFGWDSDLINEGSSLKDATIHFWAGNDGNQVVRHIYKEIDTLFSRHNLRYCLGGCLDEMLIYRVDDQ